MQTEREINQYLFYFILFEKEAPKRTIYKDESIAYNKSISCQVKKNPTYPPQKKYRISICRKHTVYR